MGLLSQLNLKPVRKEPGVWIRRIVIYERLEPEPRVIRDIALTKGLNIVWAEEPQDDEQFTNITGHSAGKTSFCRLLRYVLGEKTLGNKKGKEHLQESLPAGYVAAELYVQGKWWAVLRPIGTGRASYIREDVTIEELIAERINSAYSEDYPVKIGLVDLLKGLQSPRIVSTGDSIEWGHVLAWCTRDQETRFQQVHEWRSPKTDSEWPNVKFSRIDPLFIIRTVLGLLLPDELEVEENLATLRKRHDLLVREIERLEREPIFRVNLHQGQLRTMLRQLYPDDVTIETLPVRKPDDLIDLDRMALRAKDTLSEQATKPQEQLASIELEIDELSGRIVSIEREVEALESLFGIGQTEGHELTEGLDQRELRREQLAANADRTCPFGDITIGECDYVKRRQTILRLDEAQDKKFMEKTVMSQAEARDKYRRQIATLETEAASLRSQRAKFIKERTKLLADLRSVEEQIRELGRSRKDMMEWQENLQKGEGFPDLIDARIQLAATDSGIQESEQRLSNMIKQHDANRNRISSVFSAAIRAVLPAGGYDGEVIFEDRELSFRIKHGSAMNGEAIDTLTVLLCDVSSIIYNLVSHACCLPGFWIHDSPREADLGLRIYYGLIRLIASLQEDFGFAETCPFQYVLTTTTAPPKELQSSDYVKLKLDAGIPEGLLFCRDISVPYKEDQAEISAETVGLQDGPQNPSLPT